MPAAPPAPAADPWGAPPAAPPAPVANDPWAQPPAAPADPPRQPWDPPAPAAAPAAPAVGEESNQNPFGGKSLDFTGGDDPNAKTVRLRDRLNEADTERRKEKEEAEKRERAAEIRREERLKKIEYMNNMPDSTEAGTGTWDGVCTACIIWIHY